MINKSYFEILAQPETFGFDIDTLKKAYYKVSRAYHPDFFTMSSEEDQRQASLMSEFVNEAYKTLSDPMLRTGYLLRRLGFLAEGEKTELEQTFLLEMMEINEAIFEAQESKSTEQWQDVQKLIAEFEASLSNIGLEATRSYDSYIASGTGHEEIDNEVLEKIKEYYLKRRYLDRMKTIMDGQNDL